MAGGVDTKLTAGEVGTLMEVEDKELTSESLNYQPQAELEPAETLTELKPVKQNVTYDSQTGKMYAELGTSSGQSRGQLGAVTAEYTFQYSGPPPQPGAQYQQAYVSPVTQYSGPAYTTSYTSPVTYDRVNTTTYPFNSPAPFLPHSAINLSVKTEEAVAAGEPSPQILDLTRPLSVTSPSITFSASTSQPGDTSVAQVLTPAKVQTEPVDFSSSQAPNFPAGRPFEPPGRDRPLPGTS